jgi:hypothetical protein
LGQYGKTSLHSLVCNENYILVSKKKISVFFALNIEKGARGAGSEVRGAHLGFLVENAPELHLAGE